MNITLENSGDMLTIADLAIQINTGESINLSSYSAKELIESADLPTAMVLPTTKVSIDSEEVTFIGLCAALTNITEAKHESLKTLAHNINEGSFFETIKDTNGQTKYISYYTDSSKSKKVREEEVVRNAEGNVSQIITRLYDVNGQLLSTEIEMLNRDSSGKVENISTTIT